MTLNKRASPRKDVVRMKCRDCRFCLSISKIMKGKVWCNAESFCGLKDGTKPCGIYEKRK